GNPDTRARIFKKRPHGRFAPVADHVTEGFSAPKASVLRVGDIEHHCKLQRRMVRRGLEARERPRDSVFEEYHIRWLEIGNRSRPAPNLEWNHHKIGLD